MGLHYKEQIRGLGRLDSKWLIFHWNIDVLASAINEIFAKENVLFLLFHLQQHDVWGAELLRAALLY